MTRRLAWRLVVARLRDQPLHVAITVLAIALGVALASSIWFVNATALAEFERATRSLAGESDLMIRGGGVRGFEDAVFARVARVPGVRTASPVLELQVALPGGQPALRVLGLDPLRAGALQPRLLADVAGRFFELFRPDAVLLSVPAARALALEPGDRFEVVVGTAPVELEVVGLLPEDGYDRRLALMDIASAQWRLGALGRINRIDLRLERGADAERVREALLALLPAGTTLVTPRLEAARAASVTRSYRVNLNMLALVSLLTGAFLVFATQALSVLRRRSALALLRALGLRRGELALLLTCEGLLLGVLGAALGVAAGHAIAAMLLAVLGGDFGNGQPLGPAGARLDAQPLASAVFFVIGVAVATLGALLPAREAARAATARALKAGDAEGTLVALRRAWPGVMLVALGAALCLLPAVAGLPIAGYAAVACILLGAVQLVPRIAAIVLARLPRSGRLALDLGVAQLRGSIGQASFGMATVIVSFSLMVAMSIMVHSFRNSFERWLGEVLPADLQLRAPDGGDTATLGLAQQDALRGIEGLARVEFRRTQRIELVADRTRGVGTPIVLVARDLTPASDPDILPLVERAADAPPGAAPIWISEGLRDRSEVQPGSVLRLPLAGREVPFVVAGVFRDYGRPIGAAMIDRARYVQLTRDTQVNEASAWLAPGARASDVAEAMRRVVAQSDGARSQPTARPIFEVLQTTELRERSLRSFDRAFLVTYALEAVAVVIGLLGIAFAASSMALARRAEFGMLRHVGLTRAQVRAMLAGEGLLTSALAVLYGLIVGVGLSLVLVYVINRQSFSWSIDLSVPLELLAALALALLGAGAATAVLSGRAALGGGALRAVREDW